MLYINVIVLIVFTIGAFYVLGKDVLSPTFITLAMMTFGNIVALIGNEKWGMDIKTFEITVIYVVGSVFMILGEIVAKGKSINFVSIASKKISYESKYFHCHKFWMTIFILYCSIVAKLVCNRYSAIARANGYTGQSWQSKERIIKEALAYKGENLGMGLATLYAISNVIMYTALFMFLVNMTQLGWKKTIKQCWLFLIPLIPWYFINATKGQRTGVLGIASFIIYGYFILKEIKLNKAVKTSRMIKVGVLGVVIFCAFFAISGVKSGRLTGSASESLKVYMGSSVVDFYYYLQNKFTDFQYGAATFRGLSGTLARFGIKIVDNSNMGFVDLKNGSKSNVYGALAYYYTDFGYIGVAIIQFILGYLYRIFYNSAKRGKSLLMVFYFGYFSYGIVIAFIDEQQLSLFLGVGQLMFIVISMFITPYLLKKWEKCLD